MFSGRTMEICMNMLTQVARPFEKYMVGAKGFQKYDSEETECCSS